MQVIKQYRPADGFNVLKAKRDNKTGSCQAAASGTRHHRKSDREIIEETNMYDHHFGGTNNRRKYQQIIQQVQNEWMAQNISKSNRENHRVVPQRAKRMVLAVAQLLMK